MRAASRCKEGYKTAIFGKMNEANPRTSHMGSSLAVLVVIVGGAMYIQSGGKPNKAGNGKKTLVAAIVGLII
jgi:hypothetical protein